MAYLEEKWGRISMAGMSKRLNRTEWAIRQKALSMKLGAFVENGTYITLSQLWFILGHEHGISDKNKKFLITNRQMPCRKQQIGKRFVYVIEIDDFWKWAEKNKRILDFSKIEENILGAEPKWVKEQRKRDYNRPKGNRKWSPEEIEKLKFYVKRNYSFSEVAKLLHRTPLATMRKAQLLKLKKSKESYDTGPWSPEEIETLENLIKDGNSYEVILQTLNRSLSAIRRRLWIIHHTSSLEAVEKILKERKE